MGVEGRPLTIYEGENIMAGLIIRWVLAFIFLVGGLIGTYLWMIWRQERYCIYAYALRGTGRRVQTQRAGDCINCLEPIDPNQERCVNCGTANQASHLLDWLLGTIALAALSLTMFGLLIWWPKFFWPMAIISIAAGYVRYLDGHWHGIRSIFMRGIVVFAALLAGTITWFVWLK
ncbi:MAG: hypothetical protein COS76_03645 [Candidatus Portnoybacteria bacterium CG06_land_8_20_14_3_00_39_12]|uniref:Uncharacterized protein n=2 Tax=Candidatus Portnoyibacteriota TaxID=1817913 RepID=A0A2M7UH42_9BACT|nr:MAG: hypothetical protein AUJ33_02590 [Parcubacteria group bacterium CG1_02_40_25]PIU74905.1 MAG: hypothetical protein COS76_03645 [Candidatus Portnoybacteria bacterium CG06_land_8_20_14_3_00_39_12]PIZ70540.1 MAG: hypothetical protein COY09_02725 [Candidatus Portnoybacteria bacterium CG_4_10_14_0_2_um_filter_39_11]